jgi:hypothetical protein
MTFTLADSRTPYYFTPHTTKEIAQAAHASADNKYYNNIFTLYGSSGIPQSPGYASDYNVHYNSASKTPWGDTHSTVSSFDAAVTTTTLTNGVTVGFKADTSPKDIACPLITRSFIGLASLTKQGIENHDGSAITLDHDILGNTRSTTHPTAGPVETLATSNTITITAGADLTSTGGTGGTGGAGSTTGAGGTGGTGGTAGKGGTGGTAGTAAGTGGTGGAGASQGGKAGRAQGGRAGRAQGGRAQGGRFHSVNDLSSTDAPAARQITGSDGGANSAEGDGSDSGTKSAAADTSEEGSGWGCSVSQKPWSAGSVLLSLLTLAAAVTRRRRT